MKGYGFKTSSKELIQEELPFEEPDITEIEEKLGFSLQNTFSDVRKTDFKEQETKDTLSQSKALTKPKSTIDGTEIVLECEENIDLGTLAHEATHAKMMAPEGDMYSELPGNFITEQRMYAEFVAYLAEDQINPIETKSSELAALGAANFKYNIRSKESSDLTGDLETDFLSSEEKTNPAFKLQRTREDVVAPKAAENYELGKEEFEEYLSPNQNLYDQVTEHIENVESNVLQNYSIK